MYHYAQLSGDGICITVCTLTGEIEGKNIVRLENPDMLFLGKKYVDGKWVEPEENMGENVE